MKLPYMNLLAKCSHDENKMESKVLRLNVKLSEVLLFRLRAAFHTLPLFYLRNSFIDQTSSVKMVEY